MTLPCTINGQPTVIEIQDEAVKLIISEFTGLGTIGTGRNTYIQAAPKLGIAVRTLRRWVKQRLISSVQLGHKKKFITDEEINRVIQCRTRRAIV